MGVDEQRPAHDASNGSLLAAFCIAFGGALFRWHHLLKRPLEFFAGFVYAVIVRCLHEAFELLLGV